MTVYSALSFHAASLYLSRHTFCSLCLSCSLYCTPSKLFMMSDAAFFARLCALQLQTDRAATPETRTIFHSKAAIQQLIEESSLTFAPGLANTIRSRNAPSVQQLRACSIQLSEDELKAKWSVYLEYYRKGPVWHIYCGKSTNVRGSQARLKDYVNESNNISRLIKGLLKRGYKRMSYTILAAVGIPYYGADRIYATALIMAFETTFAAGFWTYAPPTLGSITPLRF